jgi:hypothetical protein
VFYHKFSTIDKNNIGFDENTYTLNKKPENSQSGTRFVYFTKTITNNTKIYAIQKIAKYG